MINIRREAAKFFYKSEPDILNSNSVKNWCDNKSDLDTPNANQVKALEKLLDEIFDEGMRYATRDHLDL